MSLWLLRSSHEYFRKSISNPYYQERVQISNKSSLQVFSTVHGTVKKHLHSLELYTRSLFTHYSEWIELLFLFLFFILKKIYRSTPRKQKKPVFYESEGANMKSALLLVRAKGGDPFGSVDR